VAARVAAPGGRAAAAALLHRAPYGRGGGGPLARRRCE